MRANERKQIVMCLPDESGPLQSCRIEAVTYVRSEKEKKKKGRQTDRQTDSPPTTKGWNAIQVPKSALSVASAAGVLE